MNDQNIELKVNGDDLQVRSAPAKTLLDLLRQDLVLTGTKDGCSSGDCAGGR